MGQGFHCSGSRVGHIKIPLHGTLHGTPGQAGRDAEIAYFVTGIGCDTGQR
jgi:hypothetical protein